MVGLAAQTTGCAAYIVHVSSAEGLAAVQAARQRGIPLWAETCPRSILMDDGDMVRLGASARIAPPLRTPADRTALATGVMTGVVNTIGSDHASYARAAKAGEQQYFRGAVRHASRRIFRACSPGRKRLVCRCQLLCARWPKCLRVYLALATARGHCHRG